MKKVTLVISALALTASQLASAYDGPITATHSSAESPEKCASGLVIKALREAGEKGLIVINMPLLNLSTPADRGLEAGADMSYTNGTHWHGSVAREGKSVPIKGWSDFAFTNPFDAHHRSAVYSCQFNMTEYNISRNKDLAPNASVEVSASASSFPWFTDILYYPEYKLSK